MVRIRNVGSITHQPADFSDVTRTGCHRDCMPRCHVGKLHPPAVEKYILAYEQSVGPLAHKSCEGRINLAAGAGGQDLDLQSDGASSRFQVSQRRTGRPPRGPPSLVAPKADPPP